MLAVRGGAGVVCCWHCHGRDQSFVQSSGLTGKSEWLFALAVLLDDIAAAFATVAFVTFISLLVDRTYMATQYALLASIGTIGRTGFSCVIRR